MTDESRRAFDNLILMCANHHKIIDTDSASWSRAKLEALKAKHEKAYSGVVNQLRAQVSDVTEGTEWVLPVNLGALVSGKLTPEETTESIIEIEKFAMRLAKVPYTSRSLLALIVIRGAKVGGYGFHEPEIKIPATVLKSVAGCSAEELNQHAEILRHAGFLSIDRDYMDEREALTYFIGDSSPGIGWALFSEIKDVAAGDGVVARQILEDLDFTPFAT